ncbi:hypothetical protein QBC47DRAFT_385664 [Echria macrotheca]|uniref:Zn(2)-C6 fungal-type domain-containing protein n=1 Tax=Echria macrotheca TaxID=438768 RepID=A0AAJ0BDY1_9PEZI|nr:hypothetical protein QBC47DRAFT_385664 [Echria macrotheca]
MQLGIMQHGVLSAAHLKRESSAELDEDDEIPAPTQDLEGFTPATTTLPNDEGLSSPTQQTRQPCCPEIIYQQPSSPPHNSHSHSPDGSRVISGGDGLFQNRPSKMTSIMENKASDGCFLTFSLAGPDGSIYQDHSYNKRRNRRMFACIPCHNRKLKCDTCHPCSRCQVSGTPDNCLYQQLPSQRQEPAAERESSLRSTASPARETPPGRLKSQGSDRLVGPTGWHSIACEVGAVPVRPRGAKLHPQHPPQIVLLAQTGRDELTERYV